jgi:2-succinyl-5-enolpyruvyl-6-hydroxy-3-cyclohexene-1-carboxylate synthase
LSKGQLQSLWAEILVEELVRNGITQFCISPGSRNTPLVLAASADRSVNSKVHFDERGACYFAVGYAKATGQAAALICTSGTAVANYLPAVVEAHYSETPLLLLTADRPAHLRGTGTNQTIDQVGIFGKFVKWATDLPVPSPGTPVESALAAVDQAISHALGNPPGPVHINCQFDEPLAPEQSAKPYAILSEAVERWRGVSAPFTTHRLPETLSSESALPQVQELLSDSKKPLIVAGQLGVDVDVRSIFRFAEDIRAPIMACVSSGLRFCGARSQNLVTRYDAFLRDSRTAELLTPDLIVHLGGAIVSKPLLQYLSCAGCDYVQINSTPRRFDPLHMVSIRIDMEPATFCRSLATTSGSEDYLNLAMRADAAAERAIATSLSDDLDNELAIALNLISAIPGGFGLFLGNSMPIRDADGCGVVCDGPLRLCVNRGASGIDGSVATACGFAIGLGVPTVAIVGDLAMLHDLNSLSLVANSEIPVIVVIVNNHGGGIFEFLPGIKQHDCFEKYFAVRHDYEFEKVAAMFGVHYVESRTQSSFRSSLSEAMSAGTSTILELKTNRHSNADHHRFIWEQVAQAVRNALSL